MIDDAQGTDGQLLGADPQGHPGIENHPRPPGHQGVIEKPGILEGVRHHQGFRCVENRMGAKSHIPGRFAGLKAVFGLEPLPVVVDQGHQGDRHPGNRRC